MKKQYQCEVDCANCALKMEDAVRKIEDVKNFNINFVMQKMSLEADEANYDEVFKKVVKACKRVDSDFYVYE